MFKDSLEYVFLKNNGIIYNLNFAQHFLAKLSKFLKKGHIKFRVCEFRNYFVQNPFYSILITLQAFSMNICYLKIIYNCKDILCFIFKKYMCTVMCMDPHTVARGRAQSPKTPVQTPPFNSVVFIAQPRDILTFKTPGRPAFRNRFGVAFFIFLKKAA